MNEGEEVDGTDRKRRLVYLERTPRKGSVEPAGDVHEEREQHCGEEIGSPPGDRKPFDPSLEAVKPTGFERWGYGRVWDEVRVVPAWSDPSLWFHVSTERIVRQEETAQA